MRIGIDARLWNETGVGRYIRNLVSNLQILDKKNDYVLFVRKKDYESIKYKVLSIKYNNWKIIIADFRWHSLDEQIYFPLILNKENLDLVHFPYFSLPILYKKPFIITIHDLILNHFDTGEASTLPLPIYYIKKFIYKFIIKKAAQKAQKIITVSNATKQEIIDHLHIEPEKIVVTYEGVEDNLKFKIKNSKLQVKIQKYFLYVGNAYPHKNLKNLILAFKEFIKDNKETNLILVGKEDFFYKRLKSFIKSLGLESVIKIYFDLNDAELAYLYQNAISLVLPSLMEGFGLPVIEAMTNKCLLTLSDIPVFHEVAKNNAIYFDPKNINSIEKSLETVNKMKSLEKEKLIKANLENSKQFSWEKMAKETLDIYESCVSL